MTMRTGRGRMALCAAALVAGCCAASAAVAAVAAAPQTISLWNGPGPGTESWTYPERSITNAAGAVVNIVNVREPSMTVYLPDAARANGAAVMILPGGGLRGLSWDTCVQTAQWLNRQGVAAVIVKYRTLQMADQPEARGPRPPGPPLATGLVIRNANANPDPGNQALTEVLEMGVADAEAAMRLIRKNAAAWKIDPDRLGMMGYSAGGGVAVGAALSPRSDAYPNFLISLYGPALQDVAVPAHAPPLFIAVGAEHQPVANGLIALHQAWKAAGKSSELHIYDQMKGPFGMPASGAPVADWPPLLLDWMKLRGLMAPAATR